VFSWFPEWHRGSCDGVWCSADVPRALPPVRIDPRHGQATSSRPKGAPARPHPLAGARAGRCSNPEGELRGARLTQVRDVQPRSPGHGPQRFLTVSVDTGSATGGGVAVLLRCLQRPDSRLAPGEPS
jgi:hypothetical protein